MLEREEARVANRAQFARLVARPESDIELARGALLIAADGRPDVRVEATIDELDALAERVRIRLDRGDSAEIVLERINDVLFGEIGFRPPRASEYREPANSLLDLVVERRRGLPIGLAIVLLEVGWRVGVEIHGVGLPGHFVVGTRDGGLIDPTSGAWLTPDDCNGLMLNALGHRVPLRPAMLRPVGRREILARVLRNLRTAHLAARDWPAALGALELLAVVEPADPDHGRDQGILLGRMGRFSDAIAFLNRYLEERPDGQDADDVRHVMAIFRGRRN
jgi:regulator of sirC expression with transglutaminase-like and TPR domain